MSVKGYFGGNGAVPTAQLIGTNQVMTAQGTILRDNGYKNYIREPSENGFAGWVTSNASLITIGTTTTAANLPAASCGSALVMTRVSGTTGYDYYRWTLDIADYNKTLQIVWDQLYAGASGDYVVEVWSNTAANYSGTSTQISVVSPNVPAFNGTWNTTFVSSASTAPYMEIRVRGAAGTTPLYVANVAVTPGILVQGAAITEWQAYTPTYSAGFGTVTNNVAYWRQVGSSIEIVGACTTGTTTTANASISLPSGLTINSAALPIPTANNTGENNIVGWYSSTNGASSGGYLIASPGASTTAFYIAIRYTTAGGTGAASTVSSAQGELNNNSLWNWKVILPISQWFGNSTVSLGQGAQVEYAFNTSSTDADDFTSFGYGPQGAAGVMGVQNLTATRLKRVRFLYPAQATDQLTLEVFANGAWVELQGCVSGGLQPLAYQNGISYGVSVDRWVNSTDLDVDFGRYYFPAGVTFGSAGSTWNNLAATYKWRIKKCTSSAPVGFGLATTTASGLFNPGQNPGVINASDASIGNLGEYYRGYQASTAVTRNIWVNVATITLPAGDWDVSGGVMAFLGAGVTVTDMSGALSLFSGTTTTDHIVGDNEFRQIGPTAAYNSSVTIPTWRVSSNVANTVYLKVLIDTASGNPNAAGRLSARRVR